MISGEVLQTKTEQKLMGGVVQRSTVQASQKAQLVPRVVPVQKESSPEYSNVVTNKESEIRKSIVPLEKNIVDINKQLDVLGEQYSKLDSSGYTPEQRRNVQKQIGNQIRSLKNERKGIEAQYKNQVSKLDQFYQKRQATPEYSYLTPSSTIGSTVKVGVEQPKTWGEIISKDLKYDVKTGQAYYVGKVVPETGNISLYINPTQGAPKQKEVTLEPTKKLLVQAQYERGQITASQLATELARLKILGQMKKEETNLTKVKEHSVIETPSLVEVTTEYTNTPFYYPKTEKLPSETITVTPKTGITFDMPLKTPEKDIYTQLAEDKARQEKMWQRMTLGQKISSSLESLPLISFTPQQKYLTATSTSFYKTFEEASVIDYNTGKLKVPNPVAPAIMAAMVAFPLTTPFIIGGGLVSESETIYKQPTKFLGETTGSILAFGTVGGIMGGVKTGLREGIIKPIQEYRFTNKINKFYKENIGTPFQIKPTYTAEVQVRNLPLSTTQYLDLMQQKGIVKLDKIPYWLTAYEKITSGDNFALGRHYGFVENKPSMIELSAPLIKQAREGYIKQFQRTLTHEAEHLRQELYFPNFDLLYTKAEAKYGYLDNPFEVQARERATSLKPFDYAGKISIELPQPKGEYQYTMSGKPILKDTTGKFGLKDVTPKPVMGQRFLLTPEETTIPSTVMEIKTGKQYPLKTIGTQTFIVREGNVLELYNPDLIEYRLQPAYKPKTIYQKGEPTPEKPIIYKIESKVTNWGFKDPLTSQERILLNKEISLEPFLAKPEAETISSRNTIKELYQKPKTESISSGSVLEFEQTNIISEKSAEPRILKPRETTASESQLFEAFQSQDKKPIIMTEEVYMPKNQMETLRGEKIGIMTGFGVAGNVLGVFGVKTITTPRLIEETKSEIQQPTATLIGLKQDLFFKSSITQISGQVQNVLPEDKQKQGQSYGLIQIQETAQETKQEIKQDLFKPVERTVERRIFSPVTQLRYEELTPKPPEKKKPKADEKKKKKSKYKTLVRHKGIFEVVGTYESPRQAFESGVRSVSETARASFKVLEETGKPVSFIGQLGERFRPSKREPSIVVQKAKYRISSLGEKREISAKGRMSQRMNKGRGVFG